MTTDRRTVLKMAAATPLALWLSSCGLDSNSSGSSGAVNVLTTADPSTIDPTFGYATTDWNYLLQVFDPLIYRDSSNQLWGRLCEEWEWKDDVTFSMKLRKDVKFHSGAEFDATAVEATFERLFAVQTQNRAVQDIPYAGVEILDSHSIDLKLKNPAPLVPHRLRLVLIVDPTVYGDATDPILDPAKASGTGAYRLTDYARAGKFELEANTEYWDGGPSIERVTLRSVPEASTRISELLAGSADVIQTVPIDQAEQVKTSKGTTLIQAPPGRDNMLALSCDKPPFNDRRARLAVNYAVDKEEINRTLLGGYAEIYGGIVMPPNDNAAVEPYPFDPDRARALLEKAGAIGTAITIQTTTGRYVREKEICEAIASYLTDVGLEAKVQVLDFSLLEAERAKGTVKEAAFLGLGGNFDGEGELRWALDAIAKNGWEDPTFEQGVKELSQELDEGKRKTLIDELQAYVHEEAPWLFLWRQPSLYGVREGLSFEARPDENFLMQQAKREDA